MLTNLKVSSMTCKCVFYRPELNERGPMELDFESPQKKHTNRWITENRWETWAHLSSYHVYSHICGL